MVRISQFENSVPEDVLLDGELLYANNPSIILNILNNNLYICHSSEEDQTIESEILIKNKSLQKATCDCINSDKQEWCKHIVASLFSIRVLLQQKEEKKPQVPQKVKSTFGIQDIIEEISHEELSNYIQAYAKKSEKFKLDMKANFARRVSNIDPEAKYHKLLDSIIKPIRSKESKYAASSILNYLNLAKELKEQMRDALSLEQYTEAFYIHKNLLQKSAYAITNAKKQSDSLSSFYKSLHDEIDTLYEMDLAPELREKLSDFLMQTLAYSYYVYPSFKDNLARKLLTYASKEKIKELSPLLQKKFGYTQEKEEYELLLAIEILAAEYNECDFSSILKRVKTEYLKNILNYILKEQKYDLLLKFIHQAKSIESLKSFPYDDLLLIIAEKQGNYHQIAECYVEKYKRTINQHFIKQLLKLDTKYSESSLYDICRIIKAKNIHTSYLVDIQFALGNYELVFDLLGEQDNFNKLDLYFYELYAVNAKKIDKLFNDFIYKSKQQRAYFLRNGKSIKDVFLTKNCQKQIDWESKLDMLELENSRI